MVVVLETCSTHVDNFWPDMILRLLLMVELSSNMVWAGKTLQPTKDRFKSDTGTKPVYHLATVFGIRYTFRNFQEPIIMGNRVKYKWSKCYSDIVCPPGRSSSPQVRKTHICKIAEQDNHPKNVSPQTIYIGSNQRLDFKTQEGAMYEKNTKCTVYFKVS